jgi:hypothetical protein
VKGKNPVPLKGAFSPVLVGCGHVLRGPLRLVPRLMAEVEGEERLQVVGIGGS